jgi:hypothetical protein
VYLPRDYLELKPEFFDATAADLGEAADWILKRRASAANAVERRP